MKDSFADILKQTRKEKHLSQQQLAEMLFVERCSVANWESGRRTPDTVLLIRIAKCLEIDINLLLEAIDSTVEEPNIIMVDDEKIVLKGGMNVICKLLPNASVTGFTSPKEALTFAKSSRIHLAFLDIEMGNFSGLDLCHELLKLNPRINIIYLTAYADYSLEAWNTGTYYTISESIEDIRFGFMFYVSLMVGVVALAVNLIALIRRRKRLSKLQFFVILLYFILMWQEDSDLYWSEMNCQSAARLTFC